MKQLPRLLVIAAVDVVTNINSIFIWSGILGMVGGTSAAFRGFRQTKVFCLWDLIAHILNMGSIGAAYSMYAASRYDSEITVLQGWGICAVAFILGIIGFPSIEMLREIPGLLSKGKSNGN